MKKILSLAILAILCCVLATSCSKKEENNNENSGEVTLIGTWRSYCVEELGEYNEVEGREYTKEYTVVFTDTEATMVIEEMPDGVQAIVSTYEFKENDNTIIYFNEAYQKYGLQIVAQFANGQLILLEKGRYWDYSFQYYFNKE